MLRRIVFSPFDFVTLAAANPTLDGVWENDDPAPFLVLYQHSKAVWAGPPETQVAYLYRVDCVSVCLSVCQFTACLTVCQIE